MNYFLFAFHSGNSGKWQAIFAIVKFPPLLKLKIRSSCFGIAQSHSKEWYWVQCHNTKNYKLKPFAYEFDQISKTRR
jgi:hypothetical protein